MTLDQIGSDWIEVHSCATSIDWTTTKQRKWCTPQLPLGTLGTALASQWALCNRTLFFFLLFLLALFCHRLPFSSTKANQLTAILDYRRIEIDQWHVSLNCMGHRRKWSVHGHLCTRTEQNWTGCCRLHSNGAYCYSFDGLGQCGLSLNTYNLINHSSLLVFAWPTK